MAHYAKSRFSHDSAALVYASTSPVPMINCVGRQYITVYCMSTVTEKLKKLIVLFCEENNSLPKSEYNAGQPAHLPYLISTFTVLFTALMK